MDWIVNHFSPLPQPAAESHTVLHRDAAVCTVSWVQQYKQFVPSDCRSTAKEHYHVRAGEQVNTSHNVRIGSARSRRSLPTALPEVAVGDRNNSINYYDCTRCIHLFSTETASYICRYTQRPQNDRDKYHPQGGVKRKPPSFRHTVASNIELFSLMQPSTFQPWHDRATTMHRRSVTY